jgi:hypothetical protein
MKVGCRIERCVDCFSTCANAAIMWQCLPVPVFGRITQAVQVATVALNPSKTEWLDDAGIWKQPPQRLPIVMDYGVRQRLELKEADLLCASEPREAYFADGIAGVREDHRWFLAFKELLQHCWHFSYGDEAVHIDLVACPTWQGWGRIAVAAQQELLNHCRPNFRETVLRLPLRTVLLLDGTTVLQEALAGFPGERTITVLPGGVEVSRWSNSDREFIGWNGSVWDPPTRAALGAWIAAELD